MYRIENLNKYPIVQRQFCCHHRYQHRSPSRQCLYHTDSNNSGTRNRKKQKKRERERLGKKEKMQKSLFIYNEHIDDLQYNNTKNMALDIKKSSITMQFCMRIVFHLNICNDDL
jgi:hypothetical protein